MAQPNLIIMDDNETPAPTRTPAAPRAVEYIDMNEPAPDPEDAYARAERELNAEEDAEREIEADGRIDPGAQAVAALRGGAGGMGAPPPQIHPGRYVNTHQYPTRSEDDWRAMRRIFDETTTLATVLQTRYIKGTLTIDPYPRIYENLLFFGQKLANEIREHAGFTGKIHILTDGITNPSGEIHLERAVFLNHMAAENPNGYRGGLVRRAGADEILADIDPDDMIIQLPHPQACRATYIASPMLSSRRWTNGYWTAEERQDIPFNWPNGPGTYPMFVFSVPDRLMLIRFASLRQFDNAADSFRLWVETAFASMIPAGTLGMDRILMSLRMARIGQLETSVVNARQHAQKLSMAANEEFSRLASLERTYDLLKTTINTSREKDEVERMLADMMKLIPMRYQSITLSKKGVLTAVTQKVTVDYKQQLLYLGVYKVTVDLIKSTVVIKSIDQTLTRHGHVDHPHVNNGSPCWGNLQGPIFAMLKSLQLHALMLSISNYLHSYNDSSPYRRLLEGWPVYDSKIHGSLDPVEQIEGTSITANSKVEFAETPTVSAASVANVGTDAVATTSGSDFF